MNIEILQLIEGAKKAKGLAVIIDVFRAFSVACYIMDQGADRIIPVADIKEAYRLKKENPNFILVGEREGRIQPGFDFGNSPTQLEAQDLKGKTIVHTTSAGTQGVIHAKNASEVITGSFVNADAIIKYIQKVNPAYVSLVCMGMGGMKEADEDMLCGTYIKNALEGKENNFDHMVDFLKLQSKTGSFLDIKDGDASAPKEDFDKCLSLNRFSFVLKAEKDGDLVSFRKI